MPTRLEILKLLADGRFHSGTALGAVLGVSRAAVCKGIQALVDAGVCVHRVAGRGYRLLRPCVLLDTAAIDRGLGSLPVRISLELFDEIDSTSQYLLRRPNPVSGAVCMAERQSAGRGRRGRSWTATPYRNLMMSLAWRFDSGPAALTGLSLAAGVALVRALEEYGVQGVGLKWPNDLVVGGRKLAGLLVDLRGEAAGPTWVVLGVGLNVSIDEREAAQIDQAWTDLDAVLGEDVDRNRLASLLIRHVVLAFVRFADAGFSAFVSDWNGLHVFADQPVRLLQGERVQAGIARGVDSHGGLIVETEGVRHVYHSGEISLRGAS